MDRQRTRIPELDKIVAKITVGEKGVRINFRSRSGMK